jgi:DNA (cytosine-5)-methyltransferase 1
MAGATRKTRGKQAGPSLFDARQTPAAAEPSARPPCALRVAGLFAGIGGIELGLHRAGHASELLCEIDEGARAVLAAHFPGVALYPDVRELRELPPVDLVAAGFPCQDLSQAGKTAGIGGAQSGLVGEVFRLLAGIQGGPRWLLLENVPFMLQLDQGKAMAYLRQRLEEAGFRWAYRTVDTRAFGLPQRRQRVLLLASRTEDPCSVLFADEAGERTFDEGAAACGFYWTEGTRGLGWAVDAVPTLKGGSTVGIPSPPAIWMRVSEGGIVTPDIRDAERLQGFPADWTLPAVQERKVKKGARWKLVGNAVSVPVAEWLGRRLASPGAYDGGADAPLGRCRSWPAAAYSREGRAFRANVTHWPVHEPFQHLAGFLAHPVTPLSERATAGFLSRASSSTLTFPDGLLDAVRRHLAAQRGTKAAS